MLTSHVIFELFTCLKIMEMEEILQAHKTVLPERQVLVSLAEKFRYVTIYLNLSLCLSFWAIFCHRRHH